MMGRKYDVCVAQKGQGDKTYWTKVGVVIETTKGLSLKLEAIPVAWDGWASLFEPREKGDRPAQKNKGAPADQMPDDDIPF